MLWGIFCVVAGWHAFFGLICVGIGWWLRKVVCK